MLFSAEMRTGCLFLRFFQNGIVFEVYFFDGIKGGLDFGKRVYLFGDVDRNASFFERVDFFLEDIEILSETFDVGYCICGRCLIAKRISRLRT